MSILAFFAPGLAEMAIIGLVMLLLFGKRLPQVARSLGSSIVEFKRGFQGVEEEIRDINRTARNPLAKELKHNERISKQHPSEDVEGRSTAVQRESGSGT